MDNSNLTASSQKELQKYLNFFNLKKAQTINDIKLDIQDFADLQVNDILYNKEDILDMLEKLSKQISANVEKDFSKIIHMTGVYVKIFLCESTQYNLDFHADFSFIENLKVIEEMKILEKGGNIISLDQQQQEQGKSKIMYSRLPTIDTAQQQKLEEAQKEIERLKAFIQKLQNEIITMKQSQVAGKQDQESINELKNQLLNVKNENQLLQSDLQLKVMDTMQFKNLKNMLQQKNEQVKDLQSKLQKYEQIQ